MPETTYSTLPNTVLSWKKQQKLGRFDPNAATPASLATERREHDRSLISSRGISAGIRCRVGGDDGRRGVVRFTGEIPGLGGEREAGCVWVGVQLDEPVGRNDGSVKVEVVVETGEGNEKVEEKRTQMRRVFECEDKFGVFARPEKVEVGEQWTVLDDLGVDDDMEEL
jgi:tubulin-specific chaperone B